MDELTRAPERILIDCFTALDGGATSDACFARYPRQANELRGILAVRDQLLTLKATAPSPTTFASGREVLLARVVRPLASSHPGSTEPQGRQARGLIRRPATRAAFAGALLFAITSCAMGVAATPAGETIDNALPDVPTIDLPEQRPPYPFPAYNDAPPSLIPTAEPLAPEVEPALPEDVAPSSEPAQEPAAPESGEEADEVLPETKPDTKPENPIQSWVPPINAEETPEAPDAEETEATEPEATGDDDAASDDGEDDEAADGPQDDAASDGDAERNNNRDSESNNGNGPGSNNGNSDQANGGNGPAN